MSANIMKSEKWKTFPYEIYNIFQLFEDPLHFFTAQVAILLRDNLSRKSRLLWSSGCPAFIFQSLTEFLSKVR